jgi:hypothetical protein
MLQPPTTMPKLHFWGAVLALLVASAAAQDKAAATDSTASLKLVEPGDYPVSSELLYISNKLTAGRTAATSSSTSRFQDV